MSFLDNFPENKEQADEIWQQICSSLAPENLYEDGEASEEDVTIKLYNIHREAR